jgi:tetratricopeptide (TPR) repeat protein
MTGRPARAGTTWRVLLALALVALVGVTSFFLRRGRTPDEAAYQSNNLGVAQLERFEFAAAVQSFRRALQIDTGLGMARINLAIALLHASQLEEAETEARSAARANPESPQAHYVLGLVLRSRDRLDEASTAFTRVADIDPRDAGASVHLGQILQEQRQFAAAVPYFARALDAEPYNVTAAYGLATALARAGRTAESAQAMTRFETLRATAYGTTYSQSYLEQGRYGEAVASSGLERELIDESTPDVSYRDVTAAALGALADSPCQSLTLNDLDGDDSLDLTLLCGNVVRILKRRSDRFAIDSEVRVAGMQPSVLGAGDFDGDGRTDLFVAGEPVHRLLGQQADGRFVDRAATLPPAIAAARALAILDIDHDGDLDLVIGDRVQVLRNNTNGTFNDATADAQIVGSGAPVQAIVATDFDDRRDIDLLVLAGGQAPMLYRNLRDGRFRDVAAVVGLPAADLYNALAAGDINKDGLPDFFVGRPQRPGLFVMSKAVDRFEIVDAPATTARASAAMLVDYDSDGLLDLLAFRPEGPGLWRSIGEQWVDVSDRAFIPGSMPAGDPVTALAMGDLDSDGDTDLVAQLASGRLRVLHNDSHARNRSLRVHLTPRVSNRSAVGAKVDLRAGSLRQRLEVSSSSPAIRPADLVFGLGRRSAADVVRVLWPAGILQAETSLADPVRITELDRKPSSCPFLYAWNGSRFAFVTDFLGGGEMGLWIGPSTWNQPDADEYVRIEGSQLQPRDGRYEIRVTNELEETTFIDQLELMAIDHAPEVSIFPNEGLTAHPKTFRLFTTKAMRPSVAAVDDHGHDVRAEVAALDRRYPDDFPLSPIRGYADTHSLVLDLGADTDRAVLLLTGWTDYAFSSDNVAAHQAGLALRPPSLQVKDAAGRWQTAIDDIGFPVGRPQTVAVDLAGRFRGPSREVRIVTNMRVYWDQILVDPDGRPWPIRVTRRTPVAADLAWRGFSAPVAADGREPVGYDYTRVGPWSPWKALVGNYTREGDVRALLADVDDMFVVSMPGDQIAAAFDVAAFPPLAPNHTRTFLLYANGFSKEMNPRSASPDRVGPLPFHGMTRYPYGVNEVYPSTPAHHEYLSRYQTRTVSKPLPPLDGTHERARN